MTRATVHLAVFDTFADWEVGYVTAHIQRRQWQRQPGRYAIRTVGPSRKPITSMGGLTITPDVALSELRPERSAMLILPGGDSWAEGSMAGFRSAARAFLTAGVPVAAICGATFGLALEGLLDERWHTSNAAQFLALSGYAGRDRFRPGPAVTDGDLITGSGVAPVHFAREIFSKLDLYDPAVIASWFKLYGEHDPAGYFELMSA